MKINKNLLTLLALFIICIKTTSYGKTNIVDKSIDEIIINTVDCNKVNIKKSDDDTFKFDYDEEYYTIKSKIDTNNKLIIDVTQIKQYNPFPIRKNDIYIPQNKSYNIKINSNSTGISVEDINSNLDIINIDGGTYLKLPNDFSSILNFDGDKSTCGVVIPNDIEGFKFTLDTSDSAIVLIPEWKYTKGNQQFEYSQGTNNALINIKGKNLNVRVSHGIEK